ncbi:MAG: dihydropteroate synthase [Lachnospiraceae bacterium]|nr:dihydropteroate synthase [Lachnospiraceae bacterium]
MIIRNSGFDFNKNTYVMGILNVTPDSFSDGGLHNTTDAAVAHALKMIEEGAAIIDIGGESTRPGHEKISAKEELERVIPVIEELRLKTDIPISIDTTKPEVAAAAMAAGADIVNTVEGAGMTQKMAEVISKSGAFAVLTYEKNYVSQNDFCEALIKMAENAENLGIAGERIILDPGIGFGKSQDENLKVLNDLPFITQTGYPILLGCSRKSFINFCIQQRDALSKNTDNVTVPATQRLPGTIVTTTLAALAGVGIVRVHDVAENVQAITVLEAVCNHKTER